MSWEQLLDILAEDAQLAHAEANSPPTSCPNDGHPLETGPNGELHCVFDGWTDR